MERVIDSPGHEDQADSRIRSLFNRLFSDKNLAKIDPQTPIARINLGNGDLIALAAAIKLAAQQHGQLLVPTLPDNAINALALFASVPEVQIFIVKSMYELTQLQRFRSLNFFEERVPPDVDRDHYAHLYRMRGIDYRARWEHSPVEQSRQLVPQRKVPTHPYQFVHDDPQRNFIIDKRRTNETLLKPSVVRTGSPLLNWCDIIENADEIHVMDSCFFHLTEHLQPKTDKLYFHRYAKGWVKSGPDRIWLDFETRHKWTSLE